jgi:cell division protease FtsH
MGSIGGFTAYYECDDYWFDKIYMENRIMTLLAGRATTELKFGKIDIGSSSDIERAHRITKRLLTEHCEFGFENYFKSERGEPLPDHISKEIAHELNKYYLKTKELIAKKMPLVDKIAKELMKKELLSRSDIATLMKENISNN